MIEQQMRDVLERQEWLIAVNEAGPGAEDRPLVELWKPFADMMAITISIQEEAGQFVIYEDVGHAAAGTNRLEYGRFSTAKAAIDELPQVCYRWDSVWPAQ
jgi:hypothetical protein